MLWGIVFLVIAFLATVISGALGFGAALILVPVAAFFMDIKVAIAILTIYFMSINVSQIYWFRKHIDWPLVGFILLGALPGVILGAFLIVVAPSELIKRILGFIIILYVVNEVFKFTKAIKLRNALISLVSFFYGFFGGIIGTGSSIKAALLTHMDITKEKFIAVMATTAICTNIIKTIIYSNALLISVNDLPLILALLVIGFTGVYLGKKLVKKFSAELFRKAILALLTIISLKLVIWP